MENFEHILYHILEENSSGCLGDSIEGFIFRHKNTNQIIKIVGDFIEENKAAWSYRIQAKKIYSDLKSDIIRRIFLNADILKTKGKLIQKLNEAQLINEDKLSYILLDISNETKLNDVDLKLLGVEYFNLLNTTIGSLYKLKVDIYKDNNIDEKSKDRSINLITNIINKCLKDINKIQIDFMFRDKTDKNLMLKKLLNVFIQSFYEID